MLARHDQPAHCPHRHQRSPHPLAPRAHAPARSRRVSGAHNTGSAPCPIASKTRLLTPMMTRPRRSRHNRETPIPTPTPRISRATQSSHARPSRRRGRARCRSEPLGLDDRRGDRRARPLRPHAQAVVPARLAPRRRDRRRRRDLPTTCAPPSEATGAIVKRRAGRGQAADAADRRSALEHRYSVRGR